MCTVDLETTHADPQVARIVSATVGYVGGGKPTETETVLVKPDIEIPQEAIAVHGITNEMVAKDGIPLLDGIFVIGKLLDAGLDDNTALVDFNARYDLTVLDREARRADALDLLTGIRARVVDPLVIDKHIEKYRKGSRTLAAMCEHYGATHDGAHDATYDAIAAARLAWAIAVRGQLVRRVRNKYEREEFDALAAQWMDVRHDLAKLHEAQREWAAEQARSLADYFDEKGDAETADHIRLVEAPHWPVIPPAEQRLRK